MTDIQNDPYTYTDTAPQQDASAPSSGDATAFDAAMADAEKGAAYDGQFVGDGHLGWHELTDTFGNEVGSWLHGNLAETVVIDGKD